MRILAKVGQFAVKEVEKKDGSGVFYVVEKSRKDDATGKWESESIFLKPAEMAVAAELLFVAFAALAREFAVLQNNKQSGGGDF